MKAARRFQGPVARKGGAAVQGPAQDPGQLEEEQGCWEMQQPKVLPKTHGDIEEGQGALGGTRRQSPTERAQVPPHGGLLPS